MSDQANIAAVLESRAVQHPNRVAIVEGSGPAKRVTTYQQLHLRASSIGGALRRAGLCPGDAVLVLTPMSAALYQVLFGLYWAGLTAVVPGPVVNRQSIGHACGITHPRALVGTAKLQWFWPLIPGLAGVAHHFTLGPSLLWCTSLREGAPAVTGYAHGPPAHCVADAPALITFTSGSTGIPKAAVRTHGFLLAQHRALESSIELEPEQVDLTTLPVFLLANLASGLSSVIADADIRHPGAIEPGRLVDQINEYEVSRTVASPALLERLADHCLSTGQKLATLTRVYTGGAAVFPRLLRKLAEIAPSARIISVYGSTEAEPIAHIAWQDTTRGDVAAMERGEGLLAGRPEPSVQLRIVRQQWSTPIEPCTRLQFEAMCEPADTPGEIVITGDHVLKGYLGGLGDAETKFRVEGQVWHRTGDAGRVDKSGRLWLLGRCEARIQRGEGFLFPFAVETAASEVAGLARSALIEHHGRIILVLELIRGVAHNAVKEAVRVRTAWASIDQVITLREIPVDRRHQAKIDYPALRATLARRLCQNSV